MAATNQRKAGEERKLGILYPKQLGSFDGGNNQSQKIKGFSENEVIYFSENLSFCNSYIYYEGILVSMNRGV
jgi:hypothetical protein